MSEEHVGNAVDLRSKCTHFRVLVIGRANAGKTTLLKKLCNSIEDPEIFDEGGKKCVIFPELIIASPAIQRGIHDIDKQLVFKSNQRFIFHDSEGFESGSKDEANKVQTFIADRAAAHSLSAQLHVIWYCLPTDNHRPLLNFDHTFFDTDLAGKVPVIAVFTKFDGLITQAFLELKGQGVPRIQALEARHRRAEQKLETDFIKHLEAKKYPPSGYVRLDGESSIFCMSPESTDLIESTAAALTDETLRLLFVSVQRNNIDLCIKYAMKQ
ncbi:hypothetical protein GGX14DRAFT_365278 [Mycena pura]|uniref:G domain-containing protein n=1 Tax=Mycena pura TaxID=153505 RepID=A0AAD6YAH6_9AGAR|nr:hypothetical protein GGX14DRAFT_365278 [Mycena pura]